MDTRKEIRKVVFSSTKQYYSFRKLSTKYTVLVIVEDFLKFCRLYSVKSTSRKEINECIIRQKQIFETSAKIISDKGTVYQNQVIT